VVDAGDARCSAPGNSTFAPAPDANSSPRWKAYSPFFSAIRVVLLNFWATWCQPCRAEIPEFNALQRDLESKGLTVVGVFGLACRTTQILSQFSKRHQAGYTVLRALKRWFASSATVRVCRHLPA